jgi:hypothetical protein
VLRHSSAFVLAILLVALPSWSRAAEPGAPRAGAVPADSLELPVGSAHLWQTGILRPDRLEHASLSLSLGVGVGLVSGRPAAGAGAALAIGFLKELSDDPFDRGDLLADAIGAALAALVVDSLTRR